MNIQSKEHADEFGAFVQRLCKKVWSKEGFRDCTTQHNFGYTIEKHNDGVSDYHTVSFPWCAADIGFPIVLESITGNREVPGYHVWTSTWRPSYNRMEPDDYDLNTLLETESFNRAVNVVVDQFVSWRLRMLADERYSREHVEGGHPSPLPNAIQGDLP